MHNKVGFYVTDGRPPCARKVEILSLVSGRKTKLRCFEGADTPRATETKRNRQEEFSLGMRRYLGFCAVLASAVK
jgi:hypothetical protein